ncbi:MAG TPA: cupin domain-containing protein [Stellaceae bacterium]|jgi:quercetin dioxygenase-like cupin family protein|nr:cupin domain-containing protein [Stellaceae bacterium]
MAYVDARLRGKPAPVVSGAEMERNNVARLGAMKGSQLAFLDQRMPGGEREIINVIGMGVVENLGDPNLAPKISAPAHGFAVTYVRNTPKGSGAALHRHPTEEVFIAVKGPWEVFWLEGESERKITLQPGDIVNVPIGIYRGFRSGSDDPEATLIAIVGGPDPGKVDWHPSVIEAARKTGLSVDDEGRLIVAEAAQ